MYKRAKGTLRWNPNSKNCYRQTSLNLPSDLPVQFETRLQYSTVKIFQTANVLPWSCTGDYTVDQCNETSLFLCRPLCVLNGDILAIFFQGSRLYGRLDFANSILSALCLDNGKNDHYILNIGSWSHLWDFCFLLCVECLCWCIRVWILYSLCWESDRFKVASIAQRPNNKQQQILLKIGK